MRNKNSKVKVIGAVGTAVALTVAVIPVGKVGAANGYEIDLKNYGIGEEAASISISIGGW